MHVADIVLCGTPTGLSALNPYAGPLGSPAVDNCVVLCPASLVANWHNEIIKWVGERALSLFIVEGGTKAKVTSILDQFLRMPR